MSILGPQSYGVCCLPPGCRVPATVVGRPAVQGMDQIQGKALSKTLATLASDHVGACAAWTLCYLRCSDERGARDAPVPNQAGGLPRETAVPTGQRTGRREVPLSSAARLPGGGAAARLNA